MGACHMSYLSEGEGRERGGKSWGRGLGLERLPGARRPGGSWERRTGGGGRAQVARRWSDSGGAAGLIGKRIADSDCQILSCAASPYCCTDDHMPSHRIPCMINTTTPTTYPTVTAAAKRPQLPLCPPPPLDSPALPALQLHWLRRPSSEAKHQRCPLGHLGGSQTQEELKV